MSPNMASILPTLQQAKINVCNLIQLITLSPKPTYSINGQSVQWTEYFRTLTDQLAVLNQQIQVAGGPIELQTQAIPAGSAANGYFGGWGG
jgi:hypothetical protein